jgi:hypothetical protein
MARGGYTEVTEDKKSTEEIAEVGERSRKGF